MTFRDVTIVGTPNLDTKIHIEVLEGYDGRVTLENVNLSNIKRRPCIRMAENCKLSISLEGDNRLKGGGIKVPESSRLTIEGDGTLRILQSGSDNYAIGNTMEKRHGLIEFFQDGEIYIESNGQNNIGIGSGLGGHTRIVKGKYVIKMSEYRRFNPALAFPVPSFCLVTLSAGKDLGKHIHIFVRYLRERVERNVCINEDRLLLRQKLK